MENFEALFKEILDTMKEENIEYVGITYKKKDNTDIRLGWRTSGRKDTLIGSLEILKNEIMNEKKKDV